MKVRVIVNPRAGVRTPGAFAAVDRGRPGWRDYAYSVTERAGHATELAARAVAEGAGLVVAAGGDGTVNEVAQAVIGSRAALGIVPIGSGNGLARALRLPLRPADALAALEHAVPREMDVGLLDGRVFLNVAGIGFDAVVGEAFHQHGMRGGRRGLLGYVRLSLRELRAYRPPRLSVELDGEAAIAMAPFVLTFANGPQYGSGAVINPGARIDDGLLEVTVFDQAPLASIFAAAPRLFIGGIERQPQYRRHSATRVVVRAESPFAIHLDGDPGPHATRVAVEIRPRALRVMVSARVAADSRGPFSV